MPCKRMQGAFESPNPVIQGWVANFHTHLHIKGISHNISQEYGYD